METFSSTSPSRRAFLGIASALVTATVAGRALASSNVASSGIALPVANPNQATRFRTENIDGVDMFYREGGPTDAPVVLLLHGFPTSSRMFRNLIPMLADKYRVIAPDYPAFGHSAAPSRTAFSYSHEHFSDMIDTLLTRLNVKKFAMYLMDFGGPIGYRLLLKYPDRVTGTVVQNTPVFGEPTDGDFWKPLLGYWKSGAAEDRAKVRRMLLPQSIRDQYLFGTKDPSLIDPDNWTIDSALIARPEVDEIMLDLLYGIRENRKTVGDARKFFSQHQDKVMIATGANDALFPGKSMQPPAELTGIEFHAIDSGHFALEDRCFEIGTLTRDYLAKVMPS